MSFKKTFWVCALIAAFFVVSAPSVQAEEIAVLRPVEKLSRGIANAAFGVFELPMQWMAVKNADGGIAGITYGTLKGVCYVVARVVVGVVDVATFLVPLPGCPDFPDDAGWGYGPIMKPAWVIPVGSDWNNFVYDNTAIVNPSL